jgi:hypothetical protein
LEQAIDVANGVDALPGDGPRVLGQLHADDLGVGVGGVTLALPYSIEQRSLSLRVGKIEVVVTDGAFELQRPRAGEETTAECVSIRSTGAPPWVTGDDRNSTISVWSPVSTVSPASLREPFVAALGAQHE